VSREAQARICERLGVQFPGPTRPRVQLPGLLGPRLLTPDTQLRRSGRGAELDAAASHTDGVTLNEAKTSIKHARQESFSFL
jgi:hypothetical protein